ncbi:sigma-70 family RNA polymerase sigma factor [Halalkalibacterium ligniniphilum]|uniref:sigma-70 family RNA polymerase sigma factor n=1 Tax=Halalkalibacterium ligniniphilum TaxID=1134413 RepID=UPI00034D5F67|nr:sigma-70 family RNA polymerase sigma factor [Halalkalibacterium ligniniphilum]
MKDLGSGVLVSIEDAVQQNIGLIKKTASKYAKSSRFYGFDFDDLFSYASIGLLKAYNNFDASRGVKFSTYAVEMMKCEIKKAFREWNIGPKTIRRLKECGLKISKADDWESKSAEQLAEELKESVKTVSESLVYLRQCRPASMQGAAISSDDGDVNLEDTIGKEFDVSVLFVSEFIDSLTERERVVLQKRLNGYTQGEIGKVVGVSQSRVGKILNNDITEKIKEYMAV